MAMDGNWNAWTAIPGGAAVISRPAEKEAFLAALHAEGRLCPFRFLPDFALLGRFSDEYLPWMKRRFGLGYPEAERLRAVFNRLGPRPPREIPRFLRLWEMRDELAAAGVFEPFRISAWEGIPLIAMNRPDALFLSASPKISFRDSWGPRTGEIPLFQCRDEASQAHAVTLAVADLLAGGIPPGRIAVVNASSADKRRMRLEAALAGFSFTEERRIPLSRFPKVVRFLREALSGSSMESLLTSFSESGNEVDRRIRDALFSILDQYGTSLLSTDGELLRFAADNTGVPIPGVGNAVSFLAWDEMTPHSRIAYLVMNYEDGSVPRTVLDTDYLSDAEKALCGIPGSLAENALLRKAAETLLVSLPDVRLYLPLKSGGTDRRPADLALFRPLSPVQTDTAARPVSRSRAFDEVLYAKRRHDRERFGTTRADEGLLEATFGKEWAPHDSAFTGLSEATLRSVLGDRVNLSPTSLSVFAQCRFRFFLQYLLKLAPAEASLELSIGNLAHAVLSRAFVSASPVSELAASCLQSDPFLQFDPVARFLAEAFVPRLEKVVERLRERRDKGAFADFAAEKVYEYLHPEDSRFRILGKIDLVRIWNPEGVPYAAVFDYKTGSHPFREEDFERGLDLQLVFYLHLLRQSGDLPGMKPAGFYYQPLNPGRPIRDDGKDILKDRLKMSGMTLADSAVARALDPEGDVRGLSWKSDGSFSARAKVADSERMEEYLRQMQGFLDEAVRRLESGDFAITPLPVRPESPESESCEHCPFPGICYLAEVGSREAEETEEAEGDD